MREYITYGKWTDKSDCQIDGLFQENENDQIPS